MKNQQDCIDNTIESLSRQIEILSNKCSLENNRSDKNYKFQEMLEASSIILQLSRTLNELIMTKHMLENNDQNNVNKMITNIVHGRKN